jgi:peptidoglycan biosynthesis protein MviN/MurJ (putative lipid II flippase)
MLKNVDRISVSRLIRWKYSPSFLFSGANTLCSVIFQFAILFKLGIGASSDLYFASIVTPLVAYTLAFGAINNVLVAMFVEAKTRNEGEEITFFWNCLLVTSCAGLLVLVVLYYPFRLIFPFMFRKLAWIDLQQVTSIFCVYSIYQLFYSATLTKNCFLYAHGRPARAQQRVFCGWVVSLFLLWRSHPNQHLWFIPACLIAGNVIAFAYPGLGREAYFYRTGWLKQHALSLFRRTWPVTAGCSVAWVEPAIDGVIASALKEGSLTVYYMFSRMMLYAVTSIVSGYVQPVSKHLAELAATESLRELRRQTRKVVLNGCFLGVGILGVGLLALFFLGNAGIRVLQPYVIMFSNNLSVFLLLLGYLFGAIMHVTYSNSLYVLRRERLFMAASLTVFPAGIICKFVGSRMFGLPGLAAGTSVHWIIYATALSFCFRWASRQKRVGALPSPYSTVLHEQEIEL